MGGRTTERLGGGATLGGAIREKNNGFRARDGSGEMNDVIGAQLGLPIFTFPANVKRWRDPAWLDRDSGYIHN